MAKRCERLEGSRRSEAQTKNREGGFGLDMAQQRGDVLAHIMRARAVAKILGALVVVLQRQGGYLLQIDRGKRHRRTPPLRQTPCYGFPSVEGPAAGAIIQRA